jgi:hypothetical protein
MCLILLAYETLKEVESELGREFLHHLSAEALE